MEKTKLGENKTNSRIQIVTPIGEKRNRRVCKKMPKMYVIFSTLLVKNFFGWWSGYGFFITPFQVIRNIAGILKEPDELNPSEELENLIRAIIAQQMMEEKN